MEDFILNVIQDNGTIIKASTDMIEENVIRFQLGLKPKEW